MLNYVELTNGEHEGLHFVKSLYENAFPLAERRDWSVLLSMLELAEDMQLELIKDQDQPVGLVVSWALNGWLFIEHLAVSSAERGKNYGSRIMAHYLDLAKGKMLLEVEPPLTEEAERRVKFYERLGLNLLDYKYEQPSYREKGVVYPMRLMGTETEPLESNFNALIESLKTKIYFQYIP